MMIDINIFGSWPTWRVIWGSVFSGGGPQLDRNAVLCEGMGMDIREYFSDEDRRIRAWLIGLGIVVAGGLLTTILIAFIMIATNFNFLEWME
jgi:hypothetical protein